MGKLSLLYASALYDLAAESGEIDEFFSQAVFLREALLPAEAVLCHPHIPTADKRELIDKAFSGGQIREELLGLLLLMINKSREAYILPVLKDFSQIVRRARGMVTAKVISASELSAAQTEKLRTILSGKLNKEVEVAVETDPSVIGGPYVHVDGYYINRTVKKRLSDLTAYIKGRCGV